MAREGDILFSIITPSTGKRPKALQKAVESVEKAARFAGLEQGQLEILIGFDGVKGKTPRCTYPVQSYTLPNDDDGGSGIRNTLLKIADGEKLIFLDDDNTLKPYALHMYMRHFDTELIIGRIDTQLAFTMPLMPAPGSGSPIEQGNIDPLCLCVSRRLVLDRCGGWNYPGTPESAFLNIFDWNNRAHSVTVLEDVVGVYDSGRNLDSNALSDRQQNLLDRLAFERAGGSHPLVHPGLTPFSSAHA